MKNFQWAIIKLVLVLVLGLSLYGKDWFLQANAINAYSNYVEFNVKNESDKGEGTFDIYGYIQKPDSTVVECKKNNVVVSANKYWNFDCNVDFTQSGTYIINLKTYDINGYPNFDSSHMYDYIQTTKKVEDTSPPSPNSFDLNPIGTATDSIHMYASKATDPSGGVQYYFYGIGSAHDRGWNTSRNYVDTGLSTNTRYGYIVKTKDSKGNVSGDSAEKYAYTLQTTPTHDVIDRGTDFVKLQASNVSNITSGNGGLSWSGYDGANSSGWIQTTTFTNTGLQAGKRYKWKVKARNGDRQETGSSDYVYGCTFAKTPGQPILVPNDKNSIYISIDKNGNSDVVKYKIYSVNHNKYVTANGAVSNSEVWQTASEWNHTKMQGLTPATTYSFKVRAKNEWDEESNLWSNEASVTTNKYNPDLIVHETPNAKKGKPFIVAATFRDENGYNKSGKSITFNSNGQSCNAVTQSNGVASCNLTINQLGTFNISASFNGDTTFKSATATGSVQVINNVYRAIVNNAIFANTQAKAGRDDARPQVRLKNLEDTGIFKIKLEIYRDDRNTPVYTTTLTTPEVNTDEKYTTTINWTPPVGGRYYIKATALSIHGDKFSNTMPYTSTTITFVDANPLPASSTVNGNVNIFGVNFNKIDWNWQSGLNSQNVEKINDILNLKFNGQTGQGSQIESIEKFHFGEYTAQIKAVSATNAPYGVTQGFFFYKSDNQEIDVEILSLDPNHVHFIVQGGEHFRVYVADQSTAYHYYGFKWDKDKVTFYIDGVIARGYKVDGNSQNGFNNIGDEVKCIATTNIPQDEGVLILNNWSGNAQWSGEVPYENDLNMSIKSMTLVKAQKKPNQIVSAYWQANKNGDTTFIEGDKVKLTAKVENIAVETVVTFKIYEHDYLSANDYVTAIRAKVKKYSDGNYYAVANWIATWINDGFSEDPQYIFTANIDLNNQHIMKKSSDKIFVKLQPKIQVNYQKETKRLFVYLYDKYHLSLLTDKKMEIKIGDKTYSVTTGSQGGDIWKGGYLNIFNDVSHPGIAVIKNIDLNLPVKITISITDSSLPNISKDFSIAKIISDTNSFPSIKISLNNKQIYISDIKHIDNEKILFSAKYSNGNCVANKDELKKIAFYIKYLIDYGSITKPNIVDYLYALKTIEVITDIKKQVALTGTIVGLIIPNPIITSDIYETTVGFINTDFFNIRFASLIMKFYYESIEFYNKMISYKSQIDQKIKSGEIVKESDIEKFIQNAHFEIQYDNFGNTLIVNLQKINESDYSQKNLFWKQYFINAIPSLSSIMGTYFNNKDLLTYAQFDSYVNTKIQPEVLESYINLTNKNISFDNFCKSRETNPPTITILSHQNNETVSVNNITLKGTATDKGSGDNGINSITINGQNANFNPVSGSQTTTWSKSISLNVGNNIITIKATDDIGNNKTVVLNLIYKKPVPDLSVINYRVDADITAGGSSGVDLVVENIGTIKSLPTSINYYLSIDNKIDNSDSISDTNTLDSLTINQIAVKKGNVQINDIGNYWVYGCIEKSENEVNTQNNCSAPQAVTVKQKAGGLEYSVTVTTNSGGYILPSGSIVIGQGSSKTFDIVANQGYHIKDVLVDGVSKGAIHSYTISNVQKDKSIEAIFEKNKENVANGDVNYDNTVDISDVILVLKQAIGKMEKNYEKADMNGDNEIDITDVMLVLKKVVGKN